VGGGAVTRRRIDLALYYGFQLPITVVREAGSHKMNCSVA
jgi:hypothetical protein